MTTDIARFRDQLEQMQRSLQGEAILGSYEPNLKVVLQAQSLGHISIEVEITPDHLQQFHKYDLDGIDQSYLPELITQLESILERYPVVGTPFG